MADPLEPTPNPEPHVIHLELSMARTGLWCGPCALPTGIETHIHQITEDGVTRVSTARRCTNCKEPLP